MAYYDSPRSDASDRRTDAQLRALVLHQEAKDLMRQPSDGARDLIPMPDRYSDGRKPIRVGYVEGSSYDAQATVASDLGIMALGEYVEGPTPNARCRWVESRTSPAKPKRVRPSASPEAEAIRAKLKADGSAKAVVLTDHDMMMALGIKPIGYLD